MENPSKFYISVVNKTQEKYLCNLNDPKTVGSQKKFFQPMTENRKTIVINYSKGKASKSVFHREYATHSCSHEGSSENTQKNKEKNM